MRLGFQQKKIIAYLEKHATSQHLGRGAKPLLRAAGVLRTEGADISAWLPLYSLVERGLVVEEHDKKKDGTPYVLGWYRLANRYERQKLAVAAQRAK